MQEFYRQIEFAVAGIDLDESECFEHEPKPECNETISFIEATP
jgi:hypothetical protein